MGFWSFFFILVVLGLSVHWLATNKALKLNAKLEKGSKLPSLPSYYGTYSLLLIIFPTSSLFLDTTLPENVESVIFFLEASCVEYDAQWKYEVTLDKHSMIEKHKPLMFGYRVTKGTIATKIDILSIKYTDDTPSYCQEIDIPDQASCKWKFDKTMIDKFGSFVPRQTFLSPLFDNKHRNWGLWILPMGFEYVDLKDRMVEICVCLYKKPDNLSMVNAQMEIFEDAYGQKYDEQYTYYSVHDNCAYSQTEIMKATDLLKLDQLTIDVVINIEIVKGDS